MIIYRLENDWGEGIYRAAGCGSFVEIGRKQAPTPNEDKMLSPQWHRMRTPQDKWYFGFMNKKQVSGWFRGHTEEKNQVMEDHGVKLVQYSVPKKYVKVGSKQLVFRRDKARRLDDC